MLPIQRNLAPYQGARKRNVLATSTQMLCRGVDLAALVVKRGLKEGVMRMRRVGSEELIRTQQLAA